MVVPISAGDSANNRAEVLTIKEQKVRVNDQIRISPIRLISDEGEQIGIVSIDEARSRAEVCGYRPWLGGRA